MSDFNKIREVFPSNISVEQKDEQIVIAGWIYLTPVTVDEKFKTITGSITRPVVKWDIEIEVLNRGVYRYPDGSGEPDTYEMEEYKQGLSLVEACKTAWHILTDNDVDNAFESMYEAEMDKIDYQM